MPEPLPRAEAEVVGGDVVVDDHAYKVVEDVAPTILQYYRSATPLTVMTGLLKKKRRATYYEYKHLEEDIYPRKLTVKNAATPVTGTIVVETGDHLKAAKNYQYLNTRTRELVILTEDPVTETLANVTRGIGGGAREMDPGDTLEFVAPVHVELDTLGTIRTIKEEKKDNFTEIIRTPVGWSRRSAVTKYHGGSNPERLRARAALEHRRSIERTFLFGRKHTEVVGGKTRTYTGGLEYWIKTNIFDLGAQQITERALVEWFETAMELGDGGYLYGRGMKTLMCGRRLGTEIEFFARPNLRYEPLSSKLGMRAATWECTHGKINIVFNPELKGDQAGWGFLLDMNHLWYVYLNDSDTKLLRARQAPSLDGTEEEYLTDVGMMVGLEAAHGIIKTAA